METGIQSSFIPKEAGNAHVMSRSVSSSAGLPELIILASVILMIASLALAGGVFIYQQFLQGQIASKAEQLKRAEASFEPALIQQLTRLDDRIHAADVLLGEHLAPSIFFNLLDQDTLNTVSFAGLTLDLSNPRQITMKMTGIARSVNSIALQANIFSKNSVVTDPIFSGIDHQPDGVHFSLSALVNVGSINYEKMINGAQESSSVDQVQQAHAPESPFTQTSPASPTRSDPAGTTTP